MPEISVIVPVYKVEQWLGPCVDSILNQTFRDFELILVDDGSPDNCGALCEKYAKDDPRVRVLHKANGGLSSARNAGIEAAKAPYLAFVDSDDFVRPQYLATLRAAIRQYGADMAICGAEDVTEWGESLPRPAYTQELEEGVHTGDELLPGCYGEASAYYTVAWNKLYKAELWKTLRYPDGLIHEDDAVAHELFHTAKRVACVPEPLYCYRLREGSICRTDLTPARFDGVTALVMRCEYFAKENLPQELQDQAVAACWHRYLSLCAQAKTMKDPAILNRWNEEQARMKALLPAARHCPCLTVAEKLSCARWGGMPLPKAKEGRRK